MDKIGIHPQVFKSGRFKDMLSGEREDKDLTPEEQRTRDQEDQMVQSLIDETFNKFKEVVKTGREHGPPRKTRARAKPWWRTGRTTPMGGCSRASKP
jgi:ClpP class serine protease